MWKNLYIKILVQEFTSGNTDPFKMVVWNANKIYISGTNDNYPDPEGMEVVEKTMTFLSILSLTRSR